MKWREWINRERVFPIVVIILAIVAEALDLFKVIEISIGENILIALIWILAIDALSERIGILEKIRLEVSRIGRVANVSDVFQPRSLLPSLEERLENAKSLDIAGMSLLAISTSHLELLLNKAKKGCQIRLLLLNPENRMLMESTCVLVGHLTPEQHEQEIRTSLNTFGSMSEFVNMPHVEFRMTDFPIVHGMFIVNGELPDGQMRVEMYLQRKRPSRTPGFSLSRKDDTDMFETFLSEFNEIWSVSSPYEF